MTENNKKERWGWQWRWPQVGNATRSAEGESALALPRLVKGGGGERRRETSSRRTTSGDLCMIGTGPIRPHHDVSVPSRASGGVFPSVHGDESSGRGRQHVVSLTPVAPECDGPVDPGIMERLWGCTR